MPRQDEDPLERAIAGALRDTMKVHGPITPRLDRQRRVGKALIIVGMLSAVAFRVHAQVSLDTAAIGTAVRAVAAVFEREYFDAALSKTVAEEIERRLDGGRYASASEVVRDALRLLEEQEAMREAAEEFLGI